MRKETAAEVEEESSPSVAKTEDTTAGPPCSCCGREAKILFPKQFVLHPCPQIIRINPPDIHADSIQDSYMELKSIFAREGFRPFEKDDETMIELTTASRIKNAP